MDYDKLIDAVKLCGSTPKVDQCKECSYWAGGDMSKCIPRMAEDAAAAITDLLARAEAAEARAGKAEREKAERIENLSMIVKSAYKQRDAAICDIQKNCHTCMYRSDPECGGNKRYRDFGFRENCEQWEWRGQKEE